MAVDSRSHVLIIAEAGVNHNGSLDMAKQLAYEAHEAGADIVKYQIFDSTALVSKGVEQAAYQKANTQTIESQQEMLRRLELTKSEFVELRKYCGSIGIGFLATSFDEDSTVFLGKVLKTELFKIPSGELTNYPFLVQVARYGRPIIMSCGMSTTEDIGAAISVLKENGAGAITLLHCNTQYPTPYHDVNLLAMNTLAKEFDVSVGYSDHTAGIEVPIAAVALGARVIEKHFTLDRSLEGPDHKASLEPDQLKRMVVSIRNIEEALGTSVKVVTPSEADNIAVVRKSIVAKRHIEEGEVFSESNLTAKRPGTGMSPMLWRDVIGKKAPCAFEIDEMIHL